MRFLLVSLFLFFSCNLWTTEARTDSGRNCRIIFPERPRDAPRIAFLFDGKKSHKVNLPSMNFSNVIPLPPGEVTLFLTTTEITDSNGLPKDAPTLKIAENVQEFYIILSAQTADSELPLKMKIVNIGDGKLKPGETLWLNQSKFFIVAELGDTEISVNSDSQTVSPRPMDSSGYYRAELSYRTQAGGDFRRITEQNWWHDEKSRHLGFITESEGTLPKIFFFRDFR